jgi:arsenite-transporting ATPase
VLLALQDTIEKHGDRDFVVFDTPPTALTLKLLTLPRMSLLWLRELSDFRKAILHKKEIITRIKRARAEQEEERDPILSRVESLIDRYESFSSVLQDRERTRIFIVLNRDKLSLAESTTIWKELKELGLPRPAVILNRDEEGEETPEDGGFRAVLEKQFPGAPILRLGRQNQEVVGVDLLDAIGLPMDVDEL